jgi:hypothetical protein
MQVNSGIGTRGTRRGLDTAHFLAPNSLASLSIASMARSSADFGFESDFEAEEGVLFVLLEEFEEVDGFGVPIGVDGFEAVVGALLILKELEEVTVGFIGFISL